MNFARLIDFIEREKDNILKTYYSLHELAEVGWNEKKTSSFLINVLKKNGLPVHVFQDHYGFYVDLEGESDEVIALRADMDALMQNVHGEVKANHSCGHDAHSTMVLFAALAISSLDQPLPTRVRFIFQPAEETLEGALQLIEDGFLNDVKRLFGVHLRPNKEVPYGKASPVILHGANKKIKGVIKGLQAHASRPEQGKNSIEVASLLIQSLKMIHLKNESPFSVKMTKIEDGNGSSTNVIPDKVTFFLDLRAQTNGAMEELEKKTVRCMEMVEYLTGSTISWECEGFAPAASPKETVIHIVEQAIAGVLGEENVSPPCLTPGAEDFHFYSLKNDQVESTMIGLGCGLTPGLHHPDMQFNVDSLIYGTKILACALLYASQSEK
jgi:amidohydrolase